MALVQCKECNNKISNTATACPQCGAPVASKAISKSAVAPIVGIVIGILLCFMGPMLAIIGGFIIFGSGLLLAIRLVALFFGAVTK